MSQSDQSELSVNLPATSVRNEAPRQDHLIADADV